MGINDREGWAVGAVRRATYKVFGKNAVNKLLLYIETRIKKRNLLLIVQYGVLPKVKLGALMVLPLGDI